MNDLVTIRTAMLASQLSVAVSYLEDNGIKCNLKGAMVPYVGCQGMVDLQVAKADVDAAKKLLIDGEFSTPQDFEELGI